jgi:hypothetical protein
VVSRRSPKAIWFSTKGERSGGLKEYGNQVNDGFCSPIFLVWLDTEFDIFLLGSKMRYRHSNDVKWHLVWDERSPMGALVRPSNYLRFGLGVRGGNLYGRCRYWRNVFEFHAGGKLRMFGGSGPRTLLAKGVTDRGGTKASGSME